MAKGHARRRMHIEGSEGCRGSILQKPWKLFDLDMSEADLVSGM